MILLISILECTVYIKEKNNRNQKLLETTINDINKKETEIKTYKEQLEKYKELNQKEEAQQTKIEELENIIQELNQLNSNLQMEINHKNSTITTLMSNFTKQTFSFMSRKLINDALIELKNTDNVDKGIPSVRDETIKYLMARKKCICGCDLSDPTSEAVQELMQLLKYIPPQSLGSAISQFQDRASMLVKSSDNYFSNIESLLSTIRGCSNKIEEIEHQIGEIDKSILKSSNTKVKDLKSRQNDMENTVKDLRDQLKRLEIQNGVFEKEKQDAEAEISRLQMKIEKNKSIEEQILYARAAYNKFKQTYDFEEAKTREKLEDQINELFKQIYAGGMTINIDEKYKITSYVNELQDNSANIDANTAKSYSIIFAFIVGVINLAKQKVNDKTEESSIVTDEYPLVMDAPLSSFDQRRIKNICEVIPNIARQVIIFIKDSDGNIAKKEMQSKIGTEYEVSLRDKEYPVDSKITKVGE